MSFIKEIENKDLVEIELKIKKQIQKYAIEPKETRDVKRYTDKYYKSKLTNTQKMQTIVEYEILPDELRKMLKTKNKNFVDCLQSSSTTEMDSEDDNDVEDDENDYNIDYENNNEEFVEEEEYKDDEYES